MSYDVEIKIFGLVSDAEAIWELALSASSEGRINWLERFSNADFAEMLEKAARDGSPVTLTKPDTTDLFDEVTIACQEAELSYVVNYGERGAEGFSHGFSWRPGMKEECQFLLNGKNVVIDLADVEKAAKKGIDAVNALVDSTTANIRAGKIEIDPEFAEAYQAHANSGEAWGA